MKLNRLTALALTLLIGVSACLCVNAQTRKQYRTFGVAFYNLENLFDTINNNGKYDKEFSPSGSNKWDGKKYWSKIKNLSYAISQMTTKTTPIGPAVIGVSEIENITVLQDLVKADAIREWNLQICTKSAQFSILFLLYVSITFFCTNL